MEIDPRLSALFDPSGNLRLSAMERYLRGELGPEDRDLVEERLARSAFDREALEGVRNHLGEDLDKDVFELDQQILASAYRRANKHPAARDRRFWLTAAASLAAIIAVTSLFVVMFRESATQPELAAMKEDSTSLHVGGMAAAPELDSAIIATAPGMADEEKKEILAQKMMADVIPHEEEARTDLAETFVQDEQLSPAPAIAEAIVQVEPDQKVDIIEAVPTVTNEMAAISGVAETISREEKSPRSFARPAEMDQAMAPKAAAADTGSPVFTRVDQPPYFPGGDTAIISFFKKNILYPPMAAENHIQGTVYLQIVVEPNGSVSNAVVSRGIGGGCDEEALRVVKLMRWHPGLISGSGVRTLISLPVEFFLPGEDNENRR